MMIRQCYFGLMFVSCICLSSLSSPIMFAADPPRSYQQTVLADEPVLYLPFSESKNESIENSGFAEGLQFSTVSKIQSGQPGPRPSEYPLFSKDNLALKMAGGQQRLEITDTADGALQFTNGQALTIEAWVNPSSQSGGSFPYIVGKGRTHNEGFNRNNQNYALRLTGGSGKASLSFFFVDAEVTEGGSTETNGHRWTSQAGVPRDGSWHHVALTYEFGKPESIQGFIDGQPTGGTWDLAGATTKPPIVDNDQVWVGSSMQGHNTWQGLLDEIAIHRKILSAETIAARFEHNAVNHIEQLVQQTAQQQFDQIHVDVHEKIAEARSWKIRPTDPQSVYETDTFAFTKLPHKYTSRGIIDDRVGPVLVHAYGTVQLPAGQHELILRSLSAARLYVDGQLVAENGFMQTRSSAHGTMHPLKPAMNGELSLPAAHQEQRVAITSNGEPVTVSLMTISGTSRLPIELGELVVAVGKPSQPYHLLGTAPKWNFTDEGWLSFIEHATAHREQWNAKVRRQVSVAEQKYWKNRHAAARRWIESLDELNIPQADQSSAQAHPIDRFVLEQINESDDIEPTALIDDETFLRRATLDLIGVNPTLEQIAKYWNDPADTRRQQLVERLLAHADWADHWVPYWQDVLAENPGLTKPMLNNSGPFRWYLHEAFSDNRSFDRIVTELLLMEGSVYQGGTAGFGLASNNDVPMAAKAHIVGTAFLGVEMKCARCHDAPYHESLQQDLFEVAAMLNRKPVAVPKTSSIPGTPEQLAEMAVQVTLKPGQKIEPAWPFAQFITADAVNLEQLVRDEANPRERLAALVTGPQNERFAQVIVNRVWRRLIGRGIVEPVSDWETGTPSHPELLNWLAREFVRSGYDLKAITKTIMASQLYQRQALAGQYASQQKFAGPTRRRLTAEQLVDSIYQAVGKQMPVERLTYNADGRQTKNYFVDFGRPKKAWQLVAISNERERPSMNLPHAQSLADFLASYGWRGDRQDPTTDRETTPTPLQPLVMANGSAVNNAIDIAEHSQMVELCVDASSVEEFVDRIFLRVLARAPESAEREMFVELLSPGFSDRKTEYQQVPARRVFRSPLTWTAHFDPEASIEGQRQLEVCEAGDVPTNRLKPEWRKRAEDALWILLNSPEFVFIP